MKDVRKWFNNRDKVKVRKIVQLVRRHVRADQAIDKAIDFFHICQDHGKDESWTLDYYNVLNAVYYVFTGKFEPAIYGQFGTGTLDSNYVAWYGNNYFPGPINPLGPELRTGFICDAINDVILHIGDKNKGLSTTKMISLLEIMFEDLINIYEQTPPPIPKD